MGPEYEVNEKVHLSALTLVNAGALAASVIKNISGNDISTAIGGSVMTADMLTSMVCRRLAQKHLSAQ